MGNAIGNIVNVALTAVGGAFGGPIGAMVAQMAKQMIMGVVDKLIDQLPIPQQFKDLLQAAFHAGMGDVGGAIKNANEFIGELGQQMGGKPADIGAMQGSLDNFQQTVQDMLTQLITQFGLDRQDADSGGGSAKPGAARGTKGGAAGAAAGGAAAGGAAGGAAAGGASSAGGAAGWIRAMAEALGKKLDDLAHEMEEAANNIDKEDPSTSVKFQVISQQFNILMNAASTAIKAVGEGMQSMARKQ